MSYFGNIEDFDDINLLDDINAEQTDSITAISVGTVVFYEPENMTYMLGTESTISYISSWKKIMLGIVINQHLDYSVDVLMSGFLLKEPLTPPPMSLKTQKADRAKHIRVYAKDMFKKYVKEFFKRCPGYEDILKLNITMPSVGELLYVQNNYPDIFRTMDKCSTDKESFAQFIYRLYNTYVYATHDGKIYQVGISPKPDVLKEEVLIPDMRFADFMCVFRNVNITKDLSASVQQQSQSELEQQTIENETTSYEFTNETIENDFEFGDDDINDGF